MDEQTVFKASCAECGCTATATCPEQMRDVGWEINERYTACPAHSGHDIDDLLADQPLDKGAE